MKQKLLKIILVLQIAVYAIWLAAFLLGRLDGIHYVFDGGQVVESDSAFLKTVGKAGDIANAVFMLSFIFGSFPSILLAVLGVVFSLLVRRERLAEICLCTSVLNLIVSGFWAKTAIDFNNALSYPSEPKPKPVYNLTWHILDDSIQDEKITLECKGYDGEKPRVRKVIAGKTKKIRLPDENFEVVEGKCKDSDTLVFVPYGFFVRWREDLDKYVKEDSYEIILYKKPSITEDEEAFRMERVPRDATFELCYWDKDLHEFVQIESGDGVFYKKDKNNELLGYDREYPDSREQFTLFMSVQSSVYKDKKHLIALTYERDERFLPEKPVKTLHTYIQNGREIKTENVALNGSQWIHIQYVDSSEKPLANKKAYIFVLSDDESVFDSDDYGIIYAQTDGNGWLSVENIPDGVECRIVWGD